MKKILLFSFFLMLGLVVSQFLPAMVGEGYSSVKTVSNTLLYVCLAFIMINVGREFEMDKSRWRSYTEDYFIAMATAAFPWIFVALYYMFVLLPDIYWNSGEAWKENLLLSRFAAPTSAGILFTMLAAAGLKSSWVYKKVQVLAIFDDLDTILLMIPLQIMMVGLRWQLGVIILIVMVLLVIGWRKMGSYDAAGLEGNSFLCRPYLRDYAGGLFGVQIPLWRRCQHPYRGLVACVCIGYGDEA